MNYELLHLESLWLKITNSKADKTKGIRNMEQLLASEFQRLETIFLRSTVFFSKKEMRSFVQGHQHSLIHLLESVSQAHKPNNTDTEFLIQSGCKFIKMLLKDFPEYFDFQGQLSPLLLPFYDQDISVKNLLIRKRLESATEYSPILKNIIVDSLKIGTPEMGNISFNSISYQRVLNKELQNALDTKEEEKQLLERLISVDFNTPPFVSYCLEHLNPELEGEKLTDSLMRLIETKKALHQIIPTNSTSYRTDLSKALDLINSYLSEEISSLETLARITTDFEQPNLTDSRFKVSFSVKQLALFIQLQVACGIILEEQPKFIHHYAISHFITTNTKTISEKSFKNGYYVHSREDTKKVVDKLYQMISKANGGG